MREVPTVTPLDYHELVVNAFHGLAAIGGISVVVGLMVSMKR